MAEVTKVVVLSEYCKSCGLCIAICPKKVMEIGDKVNPKGYYTAVVSHPEECIGCKLCGTMCPDMALEIYQ